jgi:hypothetical protein
MGYCRFRNTLADLRDCAENLDAGCLDDKVEPLDPEELRAARALLKLCARLASDFEVES